MNIETISSSFFFSVVQPVNPRFFFVFVFVHFAPTSIIIYTSCVCFDILLPGQNTEEKKTRKIIFDPCLLTLNSIVLIMNAVITIFHKLVLITIFVNVIRCHTECANCANDAGHHLLLVSTYFEQIFSKKKNEFICSQLGSKIMKFFFYFSFAGEIDKNSNNSYEIRAK